MGTKERPQPIVIVTGANAGVGFGICQRLLLQLIQPIPSDALPQPSVSRSIPLPSSHGAEIDFTEYGVKGVTLILACRSMERAENARADLLRMLDAEVDRLVSLSRSVRERKGKGMAKRGEGKEEKDAEYASAFRANVNVDVVRLDLASVKSVFGFVRAVRSKYPYVSHLVLNAGVASFIAFNWLLAVKQLATDFTGAVTNPAFKIEAEGEMSEDGLGWVWQCNVFGHYMLFRLLEPLLEHYVSLSPRGEALARVLWMSSLEADPTCYDPSDWQLMRNKRAYEASKYQMDLLVGWFEQQQYLHGEDQGAERKGDGNGSMIRHFLAHPGVVRTNIATKSLNNVALDLIMQLSFLIAHFLGSSAHVVTPYKSAISAVHLMLVALPFITVVSSASTNPKPFSESKSSSSPSSNSGLKPPKYPTPLKFGAQVDFWFRESVGTMEVPEWDARRGEAKELVERCEELFVRFRGVYGGEEDDVKG